MNEECLDPHWTLSAHNEMLDRIGDIVLNLEYWDCECKHNYIHPISRKKCDVCASLQEESPSSRQCEVLRFVHGEDVPLGDD